MPKTTHFAADEIDSRDNKLIVNFQTKNGRYENVKVSLAGRHQIENAKTAILLAENLKNHFNISPENIVEGLEKAVHRGRLESVGNFLFDGAHNIAGAKALGEFLDEFINQPITMIFGAMREKDLTEIAQILFPKADNLIFTKADNPRSMETSELIKLVPENFDGEVFQFQSVADGLEQAQKKSSESHLILVTGSLYLVGEAQKVLKNKNAI
jgi:dihydrofolate synthase/folylpolyglutamate synthase